jgi:hypothetical protein
MMRDAILTKIFRLAYYSDEQTNEFFEADDRGRVEEKPESDREGKMDESDL